MLPTGNELLKRSDREWNQIDSIIELNEQESITNSNKNHYIEPILPLPSLASILQQQYTGDELHIDFDKDIDSFTVHSILHSIIYRDIKRKIYYYLLILSMLLMLLQIL